MQHRTEEEGKDGYKVEIMEVPMFNKARTMSNKIGILFNGSVFNVSD